MTIYLFKRLLLAVPVLFLVSVLAFFLSRLAPGDVVEDQLALEYEVSFESFDFTERAGVYQRKAGALGLEHPPVYFTLQPAS